MPDMTTREAIERRDPDGRREGDRRAKKVSVKSVRRLVPIELVVGTTLVGMILLGALAYSNAVRFQRFIEPMLAVLQPRGEFTGRFGSMIMREFDDIDLSEIVLRGNVLRVKRSFLASEGSHQEGFANYERLGRVFKSLLDDAWMRSNTDFIMVSLEAPFTMNEEKNRKRREATAKEAELILVTILNSSPDLRIKYAPLFTSAVVSSPPKSTTEQWVTFSIMPSERLHAEVLRRLEKYVP